MAIVFIVFTALSALFVRGHHAPCAADSPSNCLKCRA